MKAKAFENVKDKISLCEIWRGSCEVDNVALRVLTKECEKVIKDYGLEGM